jgi:hypothetical protein
MVDPQDRAFAKPFNKSETDYLKGVDFEVRMRFIEASFKNMLNALQLFNEQQQALKDFSQTHNKYEFYQFVEDSLPTEQDGSNGIITMRTIAYKLVDKVSQDDDTDFDEEMEVHSPVGANFDLSDPLTYAEINTEQLYIKHSVYSNGQKTVRYYFAWQGGFGSYEPLGDEPEELDGEFEFFKENSSSLKLNDITADTVIGFHKKLISLNLWFFSKTSIDSNNTKSA